MPTSYSTQQTVSSGSLSTLALSIEYLDRSEISVYINDIISSAWSWTTPTSKAIQFTDAPLPLGTTVLVRRVTDASAVRHSFTGGAQFTYTTLDEDFSQILHIAQEALEGYAVTDLFNDLVMHQFKIKSLGEAVDPQDAVPLHQVKNLVSAYVPGYSFVGDYLPTSGLYFTRYDQTLRYNNEFYAPGPEMVLPYTTTGAGASEIANFRGVGDAVLRDNLASPTGTDLVFGKVTGTGSISRSESSRNNEDRRPGDFGVVGDGVVDDSAAFALFEAAVQAQAVNLYGKTFVVSTIPSGNAYYNGTWVVGGNRRPAILGRNFLDPSPKMRSIGGQLGDLRRALGDPFHQYTGIVFIGDSITWGTGATGSSTPDPRDGTLSDARDVFATASFVNEFKRYIGSRYAPLASPILSNHPASPSGQSTAEYRREVIMYPRYGEITLTQDPAGSLSATDVINTSVIGGGQLRLTSGNIAVDFSHTLTFSFTGTDLRLYFSCVASDATFYELLVNGVSQGVFSMKAGAVASSGTVVDGQVGAYYDHSFAFVRDKVITVRTKRNGDAGNRIARFNALRIMKRIVIKNQGLNGSSARVYGPNNLSGLYGDGVAVEANDSFVFCQLGTNDRGIPGANQNPRGPNIFRRYLDATLDYLPAGVGVVLMCSPPTTNENPASYWLNMVDIRDTIIREAEARSVDFVDNFSAFSDVDMDVVTTDGLHPNDLGYAVITRNIVNSLECAP